MTEEIYVFAILGGVAVLALFGWVLWIAGSESYDMARRWSSERQWRSVDRMLERQERAEARQPKVVIWSPLLGATCWLLADADDPASGGRACTVVLRDDVSGALIEVAATDPRICRGEVAP